MQNDTKNSLYWAYNLPLQVLPNDDGSDAFLVNYMPRKGRCCELSLSGVLGEQTRAEFFECAAVRLENLARLMRQAGLDPKFTVYYPDKGMEEVKQ